MVKLAADDGTVAAVTPQNWLFLDSYKQLRQDVLNRTSLSFVAVLGEHGFESPAAAGAFTALITLSATSPNDATIFAGLDALTPPTGRAKRWRSLVARWGSLDKRISEQTLIPE
jgi:hypothetical protein